ILPRDRAEYARTAARLCRAAGQAESSLPGACSLFLGRNELTCRTTGRAYPTLDLHLVPSAGTRSAEYFENLADAVHVLTEALAEAASAPPSALCACTAVAHSSDGGAQ
ncbi:hypothetical protein EF919_39020, partial [Streptomyces sp. WAC02707]